MDLKEITDLIKHGLGECEIKISAEGNKLSVAIVSDVFEGLNKVKRQQKVYALLNEKIASGEIHAVVMKTLTRTESTTQN